MNPMQRAVVLARQALGTTSPNPAVGEGLSLAPEAYVGDYLNEDWGTYRIEFGDGKLQGSLGELGIELGSTGRDRFMIAYGTEWRFSGSPIEADEGRFEITAEGRVSALIVNTADFDQEVRYVHRDPEAASTRKR